MAQPINSRQALTLIKQAARARLKAYAPYSRFRVGAAVLAASGRIYDGCNVENASYGLAMCAERTAIVKAVSAGENRIKAVAIVTGHAVGKNPCGACLQVIAEFALPETVLCFEGGRSAPLVRLWLDFLPLPFRFPH